MKRAIGSRSRSLCAGRCCSWPAARRCSGGRRRRRAGRRPRRLSHRRTLLAPAVGGSLEQAIASLQARLRAAQDWRVVGDARARVRAGGPRHRRPELLPEGAGRAPALAAAAAGGQLRGHGGHGRAGRGPPRLRRRAATGASRPRDQPVQRQRLRRHRRRAGRARPVRRRVRHVPEHGGHPTRPVAPTPASRTPASCRATSPARSRRWRPPATSPARRQTPRGPAPSSASCRSTRATWPPPRTRTRAAWTRDAEYVPPLAGLAKVAWARGRRRRGDRAVHGRRAAVPVARVRDRARRPVCRGRPTRQAARQYALVRVEEQLFAANGVNIDLELALFDADARGSCGRARRGCATEWAKRQSIHVADALAWALHADGRDARPPLRPQARWRSATATRCSLFHAGMIELALGEPGGGPAPAVGGARHQPALLDPVRAAGAGHARRDRRCRVERAARTLRSPCSALVAARGPRGLAAAASAHPLGNFTINPTAGSTSSPARSGSTTSLDMAEIPTFQEMAVDRRRRRRHGSTAEGAAWARSERPSIWSRSSR